VPDPQDPETFLRSKLDWSEVERGGHAEILEWYRRLLALRRRREELTDPRLRLVEVTYDESARWLVVTRGILRVAVNLAGSRQAIPVDGKPVGVLLSSEPGFVFRDGAIELEPESLAVAELAARPEGAGGPAPPAAS
jgi:maltooligosyltrehalose trehalohydrolase